MEEKNQSASPVVVKVGGSLFALPDLGQRLLGWLASGGFGSRRPVLLVPGGGPTADAVRTLDRCHRLGEETAHWLALQALAINARFLAALLPGAVIVPNLGPCAVVWKNGLTPILDAFAFARSDESRPGRLPHSWDVTSDSIAARVAVVAGAGELVLLKSITVPEGVDWGEAARHGWVDPYFGNVVRGQLQVRAVNLRRCHLGANC